MPRNTLTTSGEQRCILHRPFAERLAQPRNRGSGHTPTERSHGARGEGERSSGEGRNHHHLKTPKAPPGQGKKRAQQTVKTAAIRAAPWPPAEATQRPALGRARRPALTPVQRWHSTMS